MPAKRRPGGEKQKPERKACKRDNETAEQTQASGQVPIFAGTSLCLGGGNFFC